MEAVFTYTSWGAPLVIDVSRNMTGNPDYFFYYDDSHRKIGFIAGFPAVLGGIQDTLFHQYHKYVYRENVIVSDTVFTEGSVKHLPYQQYYLGTYVYDTKGRITKYDMLHPSSGYSIHFTYHYGEEEPFIDNRTLMGTHPVLMFVNRDYNTRLPALEYNQYGYPTRFSQFGLMSYRFHINLPVREVVYDCGE